MTVALITGTSTGIGLSTGLRLALDVDDPDACERTVSAVAQEIGPVDVLVNSAGIGGMTAIEDTTDVDWEEMFSTNVIAPMRLTRLVLPSMRERRSGVIVNVTSVAGRVTPSPQGPYSASKFALEAAGESLASEVAPFDIRVAIIEPGVVLTPILFKGAAEPPAGTHYAHAYERLSRVFATGLADPTMPEVVAGRAAASDEDYIALGADMPIDAYAAAFRDMFGIEI